VRTFRVGVAPAEPRSALVAPSWNVSENSR